MFNEFSLSLKNVKKLAQGQISQDKSHSLGHASDFTETDGKALADKSRNYTSGQVGPMILSGGPI